MMKYTISAVAIAAYIPGRQRNNGKPVTGARVRYMLRNPSKGKNRERLLKALVDMGLNPEAAGRFIDGKNLDK